MHQWAEQSNFKAKLCFPIEERGGAEEMSDRVKENKVKKPWEREYEPSISTELDFQRSSCSSADRTLVLSVPPLSSY